MDDERGLETQMCLKSQVFFFYFQLERRAGDAFGYFFLLSFIFLLNNNHDIRLENLYNTTNGDHGYRTNEEQKTGRGMPVAAGERDGRPRGERHDSSLARHSPPSGCCFFFHFFFHY